MNPLKSTLDALLKVYRESPRITVALFFALGFILFGPHRLLDSLYLNLSPELHGLLSGVFLFSAVMTLSYPISAGWNWTKKKTKQQRLYKWGIERLHTLDSREQELLGTLLKSNRRSAYVDSFNPVVLGLMRNQIMMWAERTIPVHRAPVIVCEWAWTYLREHPELLDKAA